MLSKFARLFKKSENEIEWVYTPYEKISKSPNSKIVQIQDVWTSQVSDKSYFAEYEHQRVLCEDGSVWTKNFNLNDKIAYWKCDIEPFNGNGYSTSYDPLDTKI